jgi:hypothetical protein
MAVMGNWFWGEISRNPILTLGVVGITSLAWLLLRPRLR